MDFSEDSVTGNPKVDFPSEGSEDNSSCSDEEGLEERSEGSQSSSDEARSKDDVDMVDQRVPVQSSSTSMYQRFLPRSSVRRDWLRTCPTCHRVVPSTQGLVTRFSSKRYKPTCISTITPGCGSLSGSSFSVGRTRQRRQLTQFSKTSPDSRSTVFTPHKSPTIKSSAISSLQSMTVTQGSNVSEPSSTNLLTSVLAPVDCT
jgi:hypothetical protein